MVKWLQRREDETLRAYDARVGGVIQAAAANAILALALGLYSIAGG